MVYGLIWLENLRRILELQWSIIDACHCSILKEGKIEDWDSKGEVPSNLFEVHAAASREAYLTPWHLLFSKLIPWLHQHEVQQLIFPSESISNYFYAMKSRCKLHFDMEYRPAFLAVQADTQQEFLLRFCNGAPVRVQGGQVQTLLQQRTYMGLSGLSEDKTGAQAQLLDAMLQNENYKFLWDAQTHTLHRRNPACHTLLRASDLMGLKRKPHHTKQLLYCPACFGKGAAIQPIQGKQQERRDLLRTMCEQNRFQCRFAGNAIHIMSQTDVWWFDFSKTPYLLHHENQQDRGSGKGRYHQQHILLFSYAETLQYIKRHEQATLRRTSVPL